MARRSWPAPLRGAKTFPCGPAAPRLPVQGRRIRGVLGLLFILASGAARAQAAPGLLEPSNPAPKIASRAALLLDAETGTVLYEKNADEPIPPASLTKLMTAHIALRETAAGRISLDERMQPPRESWAVNQPPRSSLMFLAAGQQVSLRELLLGMAVPSGNDAAVAVALRLAPSVADFVEMMNREAQNLGL
ncbi:MAG: serine hydrolase, partial [Treponema sp.]|nr:serine hydrolase [Treponema sp.]